MEIWDQQRLTGTEPRHTGVSGDSQDIQDGIELGASDFCKSYDFGGEHETTGFEDYESAAADTMQARERESAAYLRKLEKRLELERKRRRRKQGGKSFAKSIRKAADAEFAAVVARIGVNEQVNKHNFNANNDEYRETFELSNDTCGQSEDKELDETSLLGSSERSDGNNLEVPSNLSRFWICYSWCCKC